jgi:hypothetical protein
MYRMIAGTEREGTDISLEELANSEIQQRLRETSGRHPGSGMWST